eukprot:5900503-Alexandrium_andersonii.AAC.1
MGGAFNDTPRATGTCQEATQLPLQELGSRRRGRLEPWVGGCIGHRAGAGAERGRTIVWHGVASARGGRRRT